MDGREVLTHLREAGIFNLLIRRLILALIVAWFPLGGLSSHATPISLVISEVFYDPTGTEPDEEWIEIFNPGAITIGLTDYKVGDEETVSGGEGMLQFPGGSISPSQVIIIANQSTAFFATYGFNPDYEMADSDVTVPNMAKYPNWANGSVVLNNSSDEVLLLDAGDNVVDALSWGTSIFAFTPPAPDVPAGNSLERQFAGVDSDTALDWVNQTNPDPGGINMVPEPGTFVLLGTAILGLSGYVWRRRKHGNQLPHSSETQRKR